MKNVSKKLLAAIAELKGSVPKTGYNSYSKYKYVTEADINSAVLPALLKQGLLLTTSVESVKEEASTENQKNRFANVVLLHKIIDTESGETLEFKSTGTGADTLDKAVYKAYTGACKYFIMKLFLLSGDDDPENDGGSKDNAKPAQEAAPVKERPLKPGEKKPGFFENKDKKKEETKPAAPVAGKPNFSKFSAPKAEAKEEPAAPPQEQQSEEKDAAY